MRVLNVKHPYYCSEGNYYKAGEHEKFSSWADFIKGYADLDEDLNLVWRWDYSDEKSAVTFFYMLQRKARCRSVEVRVTDEDEPAIVAFLEKRWDHIKRLWAPFSGATP